MADTREQQIRELISRRQPLPFVLANWLLAELDAARIRLSATEVEVDELRTRGVVLRPEPMPTTPDLTQWPEWLTVLEFAKTVGISKGAAYDLIRRGDVKPTRRFGRLIRVHRDALQTR